MRIPKQTRLVTAEQMREMDRLATEEFGVPSLLLMENAGRAVAAKACEMLGDVEMKIVLVICGPGNNGGDGFVAARHLRQAGALPIIAYFGDRDKAKGDALANIEIAEKSRMDVFANPDPKAKWDWLPREVDLVIDALLGTGTKGTIREPYVSVIARVNGMRTADHVPLLSVDVPSGVDSDTGQTLGPAIIADATVTFAMPKIGLLTYPGASLIGELTVADIGIPEKVTRICCDSEGTYLVRWFDAMPFATPRPMDAHKGSYGHVAIVAGSVGMTGAATLAAEGALRIGAGLVTCLVPESLNDIMEVKLTEAMTIPVPEGKARAFGMASLNRVLEIISARDAAVIGPGFGRDEDTIMFTLKLIRKLNKCAIIDADALYAVSRDLSVLKKCKAPLVITPHPGEMATLLGTTTEEVQSNRLEVARSFAKEHGVTVVLKGAGTVVAGPDGRAFINTTGNPGMATGGTGDVLSGMIGGLLARGRSANHSHAIRAAVHLHGRAGELAAENRGEASMIAGDLADCIGNAIMEVSRRLETEVFDRQLRRPVSFSAQTESFVLADVPLDRIT
jgi:ADP-dependent NAD(P)H-hydrate dehydratase / NAD(P)H-hydrate epimerase